MNEFEMCFLKFEVVLNANDMEGLPCGHFYQILQNTFYTDWNFKCL